MKSIIDLRYEFDYPRDYFRLGLCSHGGSYVSKERYEELVSCITLMTNLSGCHGEDLNSDLDHIWEVGKQMLDKIKKKRTVFLDMDGVLADFDGAITSGVDWDPPEMFEPGFFRNLKVMPGAKEAVAKLLANPDLEVYIGSKPTTKNLSSFTEKAAWIEEHFPDLLKRIILVCDKKLLNGDILIDDDLKTWGHVFKGQFIHFDRHNSEESWKKIVEELCK